MFQRNMKDFKIKDMLSEKDFIKKFIKPLDNKKNNNSFGFTDDVAVVNIFVTRVTSLRSKLVMELCTEPRSTFT